MNKTTLKITKTDIAYFALNDTLFLSVMSSDWVRTRYVRLITSHDCESRYINGYWWILIYGAHVYATGLDLKPWWKPWILLSIQQHNATLIVGTGSRKWIIIFFVLYILPYDSITLLDTTVYIFIQTQVSYTDDYRFNQY